jgi:hypothetical protein
VSDSTPLAFTTSTAAAAAIDGRRDDARGVALHRFLLIRENPVLASLRGLPSYEELVKPKG